jgi:hypothetical protein
MFIAQERDRIRDQLVELSHADSSVVGAAFTGSFATGSGDRWSDVDLAFGICGSLDAAIGRWTDLLYSEFGAVHHWDLVAASSVYRVFLLPGWLQVDLAFTPSAAFGPHGPSWRLIFGSAGAPEPPALPDRRYLAGMAWHHALHARICIERGRRWQAEYWISAIRDELVALACLRLGYPTAYSKGAHLLPAEVTEPLAATLVRSVDDAELTRALGTAGRALAAELARADPDLAARLGPMLAELCPG